MISFKTFFEIAPVCDYYEIIIVKKWDNKYKSHVVESKNKHKYAMYNSIFGLMRSLPEEDEQVDPVYQKYTRNAKEFKIDESTPDVIIKKIINDFKGIQIKYFEINEETYEEINTTMTTCTLYCIDPNLKD